MQQKANDHVQVMDTTLRDGEQMRNVSYPPDEKLALARMLIETVHVTAWKSQRPRQQGRRSRRTADHRMDKIRGLDDRMKSSVSWTVRNRWIGSSRRRPCNEPAGQGVAETLHQTAQENEGKARSRHTRNARLFRSRGVHAICTWRVDGCSIRRTMSFSARTTGPLPIRRFLLPDTLAFSIPARFRIRLHVVKAFSRLLFDFHGHTITASPWRTRSQPSKRHPLRPLHGERNGRTRGQHAAR